MLSKHFGRKYDRTTVFSTIIYRRTIFHSLMTYAGLWPVSPPSHLTRSGDRSEPQFT